MINRKSSPNLKTIAEILTYAGIGLGAAGGVASIIHVIPNDETTTTNDESITSPITTASTTILPPITSNHPPIWKDVHFSTATTTTKIPDTYFSTNVYNNGYEIKVAYSTLRPRTTPILTTTTTTPTACNINGIC